MDEPFGKRTGHHQHLRTLALLFHDLVVHSHQRG